MKITPLRILIVGLFFASTQFLVAQNIAINTSGASANASAILDLSNTSSMAFLPPQAALTNVNTLAPIPGPGPAGLIVYSTTAPIGGGGIGLYLWDGAAWNYITVGAAGGSSWNITGNAGTNPAANFAGTTDPQPFVIKTQGAERMRFLAAGGAGIGTATPLSGVDVNGSMGIGTYAGTLAAPANGMIISGKVGIGNGTPNASAILDLTNAVNNLGFLLPNMTTAQRNAIGAPVKGLMVFNNTTGCINFWTGFAWENVACPSCTAAPATPGLITGTGPYVVSSTNNVFTIAAVPGSVSYTWSLLPASAGYTITGGQGTTSATFTFGAAVATFTLCVHDSNACGTSATSCLTFTTTNCTHSSATFNYTGATQTWTVPACITTVTVQMWGAGGASGYMSTQTDISGGSGAYMQGKLTGLTGQTLTLYVPGGGLYSTSGVGGVGGWPGGGHGGNDASFTEYGGGGGGYAGISIGGTYYCVAGGGGAGGSAEYGGAGYGGGGGATTGGTAGTPSGTQATGGSVAAGGTAGSSANGCDFGSNGAAYTGGLGGGTTCSGMYGGGGGGAGFYGGGGGGDYGGGGGGGASYPAANIVTVPGFTIISNLPGTTNTVNGTAVAPGSPNPITVGAGNHAAGGGPGQIILTW